MESSSEDSFLWTDASSDKSDDLMAEGKHKKNLGVKAEPYDFQLKEKLINTDKHDGTSNYKLQETREFRVKEEKCNAANSSKKRKIKMEPESEVDVPKKKKKAKHYDINDNQHDSQHSISYDDSYLDSKVKQEMYDEPASKAPKKKKKKVDNESQLNDVKESPPSTMINSTSISEFYSNVDDVNGGQCLEVPDSKESIYSKPKKKKKKSKKKQSSNDEHTDDNIIVEDKFTAEETVVGHQQELKADTNLTSPNKKHNGTLTNKYSFQEDSEVSCDEISAIKGDEDHNLHSTLFANRHIENETSKRISNQSDTEKSTVENTSILSKSKPKTRNISDRIMFEDEDEVTQNESIDQPQSKQSSKVNHHLKANTHLKPLTQHLNSSSIITENDDIWLLKCPKDIGVSAFKDINLKIDGEHKIKISGQAYDSIANKHESGSITVLSMDNNQYQLKNLPLSGTIKLRKRIPKPHFQDNNTNNNNINNQTNCIPLPETKCRHPLFGSNYKKSLKIPSAIAERLSAQNNTQFPNSNSSHPEKKRKRKHKQDNSLVNPESHTEVTEKSLEPDSELSTEIKEKKKKRKIDFGSECPAPKKKRIIKHDPESAEAWESEKTIEENLFNF